MITKNRQEKRTSKCFWLVCVIMVAVVMFCLLNTRLAEHLADELDSTEEINQIWKIELIV